MGDRGGGVEVRPRTGTGSWASSTSGQEGVRPQPEPVPDEFEHNLNSFTDEFGLCSGCSDSSTDEFEHNPNPFMDEFKYKSKPVPDESEHKKVRAN